MKTFDYTLQELALPSGQRIAYYSLPALAEKLGFDLSKLPFSIKVLLEGLLRNQGRAGFEEAHIISFARWASDTQVQEEYPFLPARVLLQDFTGVPCVVDLAALRSALARNGGDPARIEPQIPVDLVIDHSVQLDEAGSARALQANMEVEFKRNLERYAFLRWGQSTFKRLRIIPPGLGICHQVNLEYLGTCVMSGEGRDGRPLAFPDSLVGTDSHTTMINGLGILGWGVGGIEAEAAMLGQPIPLLTPTVTGVRLDGKLQAGVTATDLALAITQKLRAKGVVGQFVEYFGPALDHLSLADRATVANMAPEYGATTGFFPIDGESLRYLRETGRIDAQVELVEHYCRAQGLFRAPDAPPPAFSSVLELDLDSIVPCVAGPKRPHDRVSLPDVKKKFRAALTAPVKDRGFGLTEEETTKAAPVEEYGTLRQGSVILASITSCTNTSNPHVLLAAGLLAQKAVKRGLKVPSHVKTSLAPGSRVVTAYLQKACLLPALEALGFHVAAYGCATCIGNSGPIPTPIEQAIKDNKLVAAAVLSGNRNFEGRIHAMAKASYLCSPPLVVAYALAGTMDLDLSIEALGTGADGRPVYLKELWPSEEEIRSLMDLAADPALYRKLYHDIAESNPAWNKIAAKSSAVYTWDEASTYIRNPPFVADIPTEPTPVTDIVGACALGYFGDFITTDHISPAGSIPKDSPAGRYLIEYGVQPSDFNSYGARRGNHEVMMRGTFANTRIRNKLADREGGWTVHIPTGEVATIFDAAARYADARIPLIVLAGKMYGAGSSRDWAAKGTLLLGVKAVIAESFERIHRSNLVEMGVLPLEFTGGQTAESLGLTGRERFDITGIGDALVPGKLLKVSATSAGKSTTFQVKCRIDSAIETDYYRHGGILSYVLRELR